MCWLAKPVTQGSSDVRWVEKGRCFAGGAGGALYGTGRRVHSCLWTSKGPGKYENLVLESFQRASSAASGILLLAEVHVHDVCVHALRPCHLGLSLSCPGLRAVRDALTAQFSCSA